MHTQRPDADIGCLPQSLSVLLFSSAILPDWLVTEGLRHPCHPPPPPPVLRIQIQISELWPLHPFIDSHLLPSSPFLSCQKGKVKPACTASWCKVSLTSLRDVPGAGLGITWASGLCPQRSSFRPALPGPKDRSLNFSSRVTPPHPVMGLRPGGSILGLLPCCGSGPAFDFRPALLQSHWYLPLLTPPSIVFSIQPQDSPQQPCHGTLVHFCCSSEPAWCSEHSPESSCEPSLPTLKSLSLHSSAWHPSGLWNPLLQPGIEEGSAPIL